MALYEIPSGTTFYRSRDPLENFKIRVRIRRVVLGATSWYPDISVQQDQGTLLRERQQEESHVFSWQEKIFSKRELALYSEPKNCITVHQKAFNQKILSLTDEQRATVHGRRIFSIVDADAQQTESRIPLTSDPLLPETYLSSRVVQYRPRKHQIGDVNMLHRQENVLLGHIPPARRTGTVPSMVMYLMADLSTADETGNEDDVRLLCSVRVDSDGLIAVEPDFNRFKKPYFLQTETGTRNMHEYFLEHASEPVSRVESELESQIFRALYERHHQYNTSLVGATFGRVFKALSCDAQHSFLDDCKLYFLFCQAVNRNMSMEAEGFEHDNLFVHFLLELPMDSCWTSRWEIGTEEPFHLSTQISRQKSGKAAFGSPFAWELCFDTNQSALNNSLLLPQLPQLLYEVVSVDSWNRYRVEGYGCTNIPLVPGMLTEIVRMWRPVGHDVVSRLRRFFIGGSPELDNLSYISTPADFQGKELSKFGFRTAPSGRLKVRLHVVTQRRYGMEISNGPPRSLLKCSPVSKNTHPADGELRNLRQKGTSKNKTRIQAYEFSGRDRSTENVVEAFKRARRRLLKARGLTSG